MLFFYQGGPNDEGSMRAVDLIRNQSIIATIDLYDFFNNGVVTDNITLIHGDTINYRNKINEVVTYGAIEKPAIYELRRERNSFRSNLLCKRIVTSC